MMRRARWETICWADDEWKPTEREALAEGVDGRWRKFDFPLAGRRAVFRNGVDPALLWRSSGDRLIAFVAGPRFQARKWFDRLKRGMSGSHSRLKAALFLALPPSGSAVLQRTPGDTGLPRTILVSDADSGADNSGFVRRRQALLTGIGALALLVIAEIHPPRRLTGVRGGATARDAHWVPLSHQINWRRLNRR